MVNLALRSESNTLVISSPQPSDWLLRQFQATIERELRLSVKAWQAAMGWDDRLAQGLHGGRQVTSLKVWNTAVHRPPGLAVPWFYCTNHIASFMPTEHSGVNWTMCRERITIPGGGALSGFRGNFSKANLLRKNCCQQLLSVTGHSGRRKITNQNCWHQTQFRANTKVHRYLQCYTHGHSPQSQWI